MGNIKFILNRGKKLTEYNKDYPIYLRYRHGRNLCLEASIGFSLYIKKGSKHWNTDKNQWYPITSLNNDPSINAKIIKLTSHFMDQDRLWIEKGIKPSYDTVKQHYDLFEIVEPTQKENTFFNYIKTFIKEAKTTPNITTGKIVTSGTIKGYKSTEAILELFHKEKNLVNYEKIDLDWYNQFVQWCYEKNLSTNYIGKHVKTIKTFLGGAFDKGHTSNTIFRHRKFAVLREEADNIYLNLDELNTMWNLNLTKSPQLEIARDLFLIGAFTGLRISDYNNLTPSNKKKKKGTKMFKVKTKKTGKTVGIPIHPIVELILAKYDGNPPPKMPDQKINKYIKEVGQCAEIEDIIFTTQTKGGVSTETKSYKFDLIRSHTARRSFCTNAYLSGISSIDIMSISGHTTEKAFLKYIKASPEEVAIKMSNHQFFK